MAIDRKAKPESALGTKKDYINRLSKMRRNVYYDGHLIDRTDELVERFNAAGLDALITVGGDGSLSIGYTLAQKGLRVVGVPKTIDNDLDRTFMTFGFDTAVSFATDCMDRLHTTATSHRRIMVVEVMGRYAGWIALHTGIAGNADVILIPEIPYDIEKVAEIILERERKGRTYTVVVVAEGAKALGGDLSVTGKAVGQAEKLGGVGDKVAHRLEAGICFIKPDKREMSFAGARFSLWRANDKNVIEIKGDRKGQFSVDVRHPFRLIFEPAHDPVPTKDDGGLDPAKVTRIRVLSVEDYHGD
jgi:hypothetical protein